MPHLAIVLAALALLAACAPVDVLNASTPRAGVTVTRDVAYGTHPRQRMDIWRPADAAGPLPVVVFFYGGAWQKGARADYAFVAAPLAARGFVVVVPDYRLHPEAGFPAFMHDAAAAAAQVKRTAPAWGGDPRRVVLMGHSAGAHIATLLALDPRYLQAEGASPVDLAGVVGIAGPYDFLPILLPDIRAVFAAAADSRETQPASYALSGAAAAPPMLLIHGEQDTTVLPFNSKSLARRMREAGGQATAVIYPGVAHIGIVLGFSSLLRGASPVLDDAAGFAAAVAPR